MFHCTSSRKGSFVSGRSWQRGVIIVFARKKFESIIKYRKKSRISEKYHMNKNFIKQIVGWNADLRFEVHLLFLHGKQSQYKDHGLTTRVVTVRHILSTDWVRLTHLTMLSMLDFFLIIPPRLMTHLRHNQTFSQSLNLLNFNLFSLTYPVFSYRTSYKTPLSPPYL